MTRMPTVFLTHGGGPCFFMDWNPADAWDGLRAGLESIPELLPEPARAILVVSAHWETDPVSIEVGARPDLVFDYYGFPPHTYELTYPAPGDPELAERARTLLDDAGIAARTTSRGWDHGVFVPLLVAYPEADVPVVAMSLRADLDPGAHLDLGRALTPLRDEGVLIIGSGSSYHNLSGGGPAAKEAATGFDQWLHQVLPTPGHDRDRALRDWAGAPGGRFAHPREEHLIPLHVAAGAAENDAGRAFFAEPVLGVEMSCWVFG
ncbi:DODA-type extradiol aromatic ring-opening family dioxygenase [Enemella sp. A6]|uniref:DODA-type extradiol aromatic ring-opening family dioxygenase n=1 Tax=Enemella sp. A6 TaxID=3440152 RepID=UPI003EB8C52A